MAHELSNDALSLLQRYAELGVSSIPSWGAITFVKGESHPRVWLELVGAGLVKGQKPIGGEWKYYRLTPLGEAFLALTRC